MDSTIIPSFSREFIEIKHCFNILISIRVEDTNVILSEHFRSAPALA